jgi:hypothetical protein
MCVTGRAAGHRPRPPAEASRPEAEAYIMQCEAATMAFLRDRATTISLPTLYAFEGPGSAGAAKARAPYMLIEGFYKNSLQDVAQSVYNLPVSSEG